MRKFIHVHASPYLFEKNSHSDATVIKPDRNQLVYSKNGYYNFHRSKRWPSGQGLGLRGRGSIFTLVAMNIVFLSKTYYSQKVLVILRKRLFRPDMTKNCLMGR